MNKEHAPMKHSTHTRAAAQDRWLISYADFSTLLFALFATMYAISSVDAHKLTTVAQGVQQAFEEPAPKQAARPHLPIADPAALDLVEDIQPLIERELADELAGHRLEISTDRRGVVLSIPETGFFAVGSDEISPAAQALMTRVASTLAPLENTIRVEGHTDDQPIHTERFRSNWDLSTARATSVVALLVERGGIAPDRLSATGYGEFHPKADNRVPGDRARNRRVDLVVLNGTTRLAEEPSSGTH
jgi:chemotaxis protein MotB